MTNQSITNQDSNKTLDNNLKKLYDKDFYQWIQKTSQLIREGKFQSIDWESVIEEIEGLAIEEKTNIENNLIALLRELLKYKYYQRNLSGMELSRIYDYQDTIISIIDFSPSLMEYLEEIFDENYQLAREFAEAETDLPLETFPIIPPMSAKTILHKNHDPKHDWKVEDLFITK